MNAMEEMRDGGELSFVVAARDGRIVVEVSDTGRGIPDNVRARIFDPYFTTKSNGSGMGLAVCDKVIQQHNGQIAFQSSTQGTVFQISLPVKSS